MEPQRLLDYFTGNPRLRELCSQNGWPDPDTLRVSVERERPGELLCTVRFEELVVEGSGCCADRIECWGEFRLGLDAAGRITHAERVAGPPA